METKISYNQEEAVNVFSMIPEPILKGPSLTNYSSSETSEKSGPVKSSGNSYTRQQKNPKRNPKESTRHIYQSDDTKNPLEQMSNLSVIIAQYKSTTKNLTLLHKECLSLDSIFTYFKNQPDFHCQYDQLIQTGKDIKSGYFKKTNISSKKSDFLQEYLDLEPPKKLITLKEHGSSLRVVDEEFSHLCDECFGAAPNPFKMLIGDALTEYNHWTREFVRIKEATEERLTILSNWMIGYANHIKSLLEGSVDVFPPVTVSFEDIKTHTSNMHRLYKRIPQIFSSIRALRDEVIVRCFKINFAIKLYSEISKSSLSSTDSESTQPPMTLLQFVSKAGSIQSDFMKAVCLDIIQELERIHSHGKPYKFLNPASILLVGKATIKLQSASSVKSYEPLPPWVFKAPEISNIPYSHTDRKQFIPADVFSFAQVIIWLASLQGDFFYGGFMETFRTQCPLIDEALDVDPTKRPTLKRMLKNLPNICDKLFQSHKPKPAPAKPEVDYWSEISQAQKQLAIQEAKKLEYLLAVSDEEDSFDMTYLNDELFIKNQNFELFSDGELSDPGSEFAQRVDHKLQKALQKNPDCERY